MRPVVLSLGILLVLAPLAAAQAPMVLKAEADRVSVVEKIKPAVVAIFARGGQGGGTGVLINDQGYALTNFHVVQPTGPTPQCGLPDGVLYDAIVVGIDKVGDVALIKLLPKKAGQKFPYAVMGDSDKVHEGDWAIAMGNPFLLATDFTPTVTFGLVSGVHRYQPPAGIFLEYTDCIQTDTSINPGNSGGPLFNLQGEIIGINGRGSFDKRARINSGVGYAISINQIKNFMGHLRAGLDVDHASLGALVKTQTENNGIGKSTVTSILEESDAYRRGLDQDDEVLSFAGRVITSDNHYKNIVGIFPRGWRVPLDYRRGDVRKEVLVRLMGVQKKEIDEAGVLQPQQQPPQPPAPKDQPNPKKVVLKGAPVAEGPAAKFYEPKPGFANYYFNRQEKARLFKSFQAQSDLSALAGSWTIEGDVRLLKARADSKFKIVIKEEKESKDSKTERTFVDMRIGAFDYTLEPLSIKNTQKDLRNPRESGGILSALYVWRHLLTQGEKGFPSNCTYGGTEPLYPPLPDGSPPKSWMQTRVEADVLNTGMGVFTTKWYFDRGDEKLLGMELNTKEYEDPCEVFFADYKNVDGRQLPHRISVYHSDTHYATFTVTGYKLSAN